MTNDRRAMKMVAKTTKMNATTMTKITRVLATDKDDDPRRQYDNKCYKGFYQRDGIGAIALTW